MKRFGLFTGILLIAMAGMSCRQNAVVPPATTQRTPVFLYSSNNGEMRIMNIEFGEEGTTHSIERLGSVGPSNTIFGFVEDSLGYSYTWSRYDPADPDFNAAVILRKINRINPRYNTLFQRQIVHINTARRTQILRYFSELNNSIKEIEYFNLDAGEDAERSVAFVDTRRFLVLHTDAFDFPNGEPLPVGRPKKIAYLLRYDLFASNAADGEIIADFDVTSSGSDVKNIPGWKADRGRVLSSANGQFYIVWHPIWHRKNNTPYIIRTDGSMAYNPKSVRTIFENRTVGSNSFAIATHPVRDSVLAVADAFQRELSIVRVPMSDFGEPMERLMTLNLDDIIPGAGAYPRDLMVEERNVFMEFNRAGTKLAITQSLIDGQQANVIIWDISTNDFFRYRLNPLASLISADLTHIGSPAFAFNSPNPDLLYFTAATGPGGGSTQGGFFVLDTSVCTPGGDGFCVETADQLNPADFEFVNISEEQLTFAPHLIGR